jgi:hypothetical protein
MEEKSTGPSICVRTVFVLDQRSDELPRPGDSERELQVRRLEL